MKFIDNFCLFYTNSNNKSFKIIDLQIDNIFILVNNIFATFKKKKLKKIKLLVKNREKLIFYIFIKFNKGYIRLANNNCLFSIMKSSANVYI